MSLTLKKLLILPLNIDNESYIKNYKGDNLLRLCAVGKHQKEWSIFVLQAINEKIKRDFGEQLRWVVLEGDLGKGRSTYKYYQCPKCKTERIFPFNFCTDCGQKLLPPEEK